MNYSHIPENGQISRGIQGILRKEVTNFPNGRYYLSKGLMRTFGFLKEKNVRLIHDDLDFEDSVFGFFI